MWFSKYEKITVDYYRDGAFKEDAEEMTKDGWKVGRLTRPKYDCKRGGDWFPLRIEWRRLKRTKKE